MSVFTCALVMPLVVVMCVLLSLSIHVMSVYPPFIYIICSGYIYLYALRDLPIYLVCLYYWCAFLGYWPLPERCKDYTCFFQEFRSIVSWNLFMNAMFHPYPDHQPFECFAFWASRCVVFLLSRF